MHSKQQPRVCHAVLAHCPRAGHAVVGRVKYTLWSRLLAGLLSILFWRVGKGMNL